MQQNAQPPERTNLNPAPDGETPKPARRPDAVAYAWFWLLIFLASGCLVATVGGVWYKLFWLGWVMQ